MTEYELYHHGIKGQKWGIRRTAAQLGHRVASAASKTGKTLYKGVSKAGKATGKAVGKGAKIAKKAAVAKVKQEYKEHKEKAYYKKLHKKKLSQMTDKEIADLTKRVKQEASLKDAKYESRVQNARKFYQNVAKQPMNSFANTFGVELAKKIVNGDNSNNNNTNGGNNKSNNESTVKKLIDAAKKKYHSYDITPFEMETEVSTEVAPKKPTKSAVKTKQQSSVDFDTYFESEWRKEQERKKNSPTIRR